MKRTAALLLGAFIALAGAVSPALSEPEKVKDRPVWKAVRDALATR